MSAERISDVNQPRKQSDNARLSFTTIILHIFVVRKSYRLFFISLLFIIAYASCVQSERFPRAKFSHKSFV